MAQQSYLPCEASSSSDLPTHVQEFDKVSEQWQQHQLLLETSDQFSFEKDTVWGSAVALLQVGRCTNWNVLSLVLAIRAVAVLALVVGVQLLLLTYLGESTQVMAPLGGQMHLCDFGANLDNCPDAQNCVGPGGTKYTHTRMYGYTQWAIQKFVKEAFVQMHPDRLEDINTKIDPGEYGLESYRCRLMCLALFIASVVPEITAVYSLARLLWHIPHDEDTDWVRVHPVESNHAAGRSRHPEKGTILKDTDHGQDSEVQYRVAGMPIAWKIVNMCFILFPKAAVLHFTLREGTILLMDTNAIMDMILGAMSLTFVLSIPSLFFVVFSSLPVKEIMKELEDYKPFSRHETPEATLCFILRTFFPYRFCMIVVVTVFYKYGYYVSKCDWDYNEQQWVSKPMHMPQTSDYHITDFLFDSVFQTVAREKTPFWAFNASAAR